MITATQIRRAFLDYFVANGHAEVASSSLVPREDPSLLFTNAGMVQFKKVFLGQDKRDYSRAATSQKCLRVGGKHNDLENVGRTARHHTFFEMLGNFSFGDYFKEEAIRLAWGFLTDELKLPKEKLYATVFRDDDEAIGLWKKIAGVPAERIFRLGEKDNFWSMGDTGPCGPCSEILIDQGEHMSCGPNCGIGQCDCDRFLEIWNLVFMQYDQIAPGNRVSLPRPSIDTGMGLERVSGVCQGVYSNFDSDLFSPIIAATADLAGVKYKTDEDTDTALRVIADHCRSMVFLVADSILPSNEGRGYVLRRLIRRAFRFGRLMGLKDPFLHRVCPTVVDVMGVQYPEVVEGMDFMTRVVREEEERFSDTLDKGLDILEQEMAAARAANSSVISGEAAFKLYDTYGFPLDIITDVAGKQGFSVDEEGYKACMGEQKARAKKAWKGSGETDLAGQFKKLLETGLKSRFTGYEALSGESRVVALLGEDGLPLERLVQGEGGFAVFAASPFYGESGGQLGDKGSAETMTGAADVLDTLKPSPELTVHRVFVNEGELLLDQEARLNVDEESRQATARNHTATHLLHSALRKVLGDHVKQAGSLVGPERLRFDFTHISALSPEEIASVEEEVNRAILTDIAVEKEVMAVADAQARGATALFGEKYGDEVRVVSVPGVSMELCGGTHLAATGQAGGFTVVSETGVAAGVRRIEGATGWNLLGQLKASRRELDEAAEILRARPGELVEKLRAMQAQLKQLSKDKEQLQTKLASGQGKSLMDSVEEIGGVKVLTARVDGGTVKSLREAMDDIRSKLPSGVACLAGAGEDGKVALILAVSKDLHDKFTAQSLIKDVASLVGGSGGGRPDMAQAGGTDPAGIDAALEKVKELVRG
ncbi:Alanine--tRNA ligase [Fundidesulfovibrio magnetotacticus]|uniref:Alanine--tRNA ligase n=1 Tax=Fundidesulfovibrio magnetotacticus TaxID=2730080 RepID=A0A6V8M1Z3_9BACT|nr:alanine--tRNA ligase [Fundidesulfovibrio magnetotacticus]GFK95956.1 Alanine--tRNA ligase [Fundidesulfovibrio magnetotacticus]